MIFGTETCDGLAVALAVEAAGGWTALEPDGRVPEAFGGEAKAVLARLQEFQDFEDMPPDPRLLRLLVDAAAWLHGETTRAGGWDVVGISPAVGRKFLNGSKPIDWPVFFTALMLGTGRVQLQERRE